MIFNARELDVQDRLRVVAVLDAFKTTRQIAYDMAKEMSILTPAYDRAEEAYRQFAEEVGVEPTPVFDADDHAATRQAADDALYENWKAR
jgi:hypothetical protein